MPVTDTLIDMLRRRPGWRRDPVPRFTIQVLRAWIVATLAYAVGCALVASCLLPALLSAEPVARLVPTKAPPVVARSPQAAPPTSSEAAL